MTTRWKQKASMAFAVAAVLSLFLLLILFWSAFNCDILYSKNNNNNNYNNLHEITIISDNQSSGESVVSVMSLTERISQDNVKQFNSSEDINDINIVYKTNSIEGATEELIKPSKIHNLPLHIDDLLYESNKNKSFRNNYVVEGFKITGNYRTKSSQVWDPHPEYKINAFGHRMHLMLYQDASFVPETFTVTNVYNNRTEVHLEDHEHDKACQYKGNVVGDINSVVAVSLCGGMTGHIKTSFGSFFIEPIEKYKLHGSETLHRIWREPQKQGASFSAHKNKTHQCSLHGLEKDSDVYNSSTTLPNHHIRKKRNSLYNDHQYTLEVLVAVDKKMSEFHHEHEIKNYILTLMSIVSNIFSDASIGNSINIAVVNIMVLKDDLSLQYIEEGVYASHLLNRFCNFMQHRPEHFDTAVLLTREQICRNTTETRCDTLGLAELGTVCKRHSCSIVQDNGLSAAFTIAHELGHILSMPHDDDKKCSSFEKYGKPMLNIMSSTMGDDIHPWSWSDCSRHYVTEFLEQNDVSCMEDTPRQTYSKVSDKLPGEKYDLDKQCELIHGPSAKFCYINNQQECRRLWCYEEPDISDCRSSNLPWADGTQCYDKHHWCQKGECVHRNQNHIQPVHGGWGPWSAFSQCSRTCGGGVQESQRECNSPVPRNGGKYCIGNHTRYKSCNTQTCPKGSMDFREQQCFEFNGNNFDLNGIDKTVKWIPKYGVSRKDECKLYCRMKDSRTYFKLRDKVIDGTTCSYDSFNKCVNGVCRPAGCDNVLFSNAKLDRCGVCEGNNDSCVEISKQFYKSDLDKTTPSRSKIYYHVTTIPKGASNVLITQPGYPMANYIVLLDDEGTYLINGDNTINTFKRSFPYAGVTIDYSGANSSLEKVNTTYARKLQKDLIVEILSLPKEYHSEDRILITYSYTISNDHSHYNHLYQQRNSFQSDSYYNHHQYSNYDVKIKEEKSFYWNFGEWSSCSSLCLGTRSRNLFCIQTITRRRVDNSYCENIPKPTNDIQAPCNVDCEITAEIASISECTASCEMRGVRHKTYRCVQRYFHSNFTKIIDNSYCEERNLKMQQEEECIGLCADWAFTEWGPCTQTCAVNGQVGTQTRNIVCTKNKGIVNDSYCPLSKKRELFKDRLRTCNNEPCPFEYAYGEELPCSVTCGLGQRTTVIYCKQNNQTVDKTLCAGKPMLSPIIRNCTMPPCVFNKKKKRPLQTNARNHHILHNTYNTYETQNSVQHNHISTNDISDIDNNWGFGEWSFCDRITCKRNRTVFCKNPSRYGCKENMKPDSVEHCCVVKYVQKWSPCSVDCGIGIRRKEIICARISKPLRADEKRFKIPIDPQNCINLNLKYPTPKKREKKCRKKPCTWVNSQWSECSYDGYETRTVSCRGRHGQNVDQEHCDIHKKPEIRRECSPYVRYEEKISNCTCDGRRRRRIICYDINNKHIQCPNNSKYMSTSKERCTPPSSCLPRSCMELRRQQKILNDGIYEISIKKRKLHIYCYDMKGEPKEYINVNASENYSTYYDKRPMDIDSCPPVSRTNEYHDGSIPYGHTIFEKIAINLDTLQVDESDYTFASVIGKPQPYGSAGDCYSRSHKCPQGFFTINLKGTGFRLRPKTKWDTYGEFSTISYVQKLEYPYYAVKAHCGGYCGNCLISKSTGLTLDVV